MKNSCFPIYKFKLSKILLDHLFKLDLKAHLITKVWYKLYTCMYILLNLMKHSQCKYLLAVHIFDHII